MKQVMIYNNTKFSMTDIYEYLSGFTTKLKNMIITHTEKGQYYNTIFITNK